jgi:hypothetical protein
MKKLIFTAIILTIALANVSKPHQAEACSIIYRTSEQLFASSTVVFMGKVVAATSTQEGYIPPSDPGVYPVPITRNISRGVVLVEKVWKGTVSERTPIDSWSLAGLSCSPAFGTSSLDKTYIFYTHGTPGSQVYTLNTGDMQEVTSNDPTVIKLGEGYAPAKPTGLLFGFTRNLTLGSTGDEVEVLQRFLERKGYLAMPQGVAKGYFGGLTRAALIKYQRDHSISPAAGYFGPLTRKAVEQQLKNE